MAYDQTMKLMKLPCGGIAEFDQESGISYRCRACYAVVGSIGMPRDCKDEMQKWDNWKELGGKDWDYIMPKDYEDNRSWSWNP
jgi:hypothetical protein